MSHHGIPRVALTLRQLWFTVPKYWDKEGQPRKPKSGVLRRQRWLEERR